MGFQMQDRKRKTAGTAPVPFDESTDDVVLICAETLAQRLDVSLRTLWRLRNSGKLPSPIRLGGSVRWRAAEIAAWVAAGCPCVEEWERRRAS